MTKRHHTRTFARKPLAASSVTLAALIACVPLAHAQQAPQGATAAILDEVLHGNATQLPTTISGVPLGGTFAPMSKGRRAGARRWLPTCGTP